MYIVSQDEQIQAKKVESFRYIHTPARHAQASRWSEPKSNKHAKVGTFEVDVRSPMWIRFAHMLDTRLQPTPTTSPYPPLPSYARQAYEGFRIQYVSHGEMVHSKP